MKESETKQLAEQYAYRLIVTAAIIILAIGTVVYHLVEKMTWVNAYYFSVVTLSTVGYGDITPHTTFGKIFTTFYIFAGVGIIASFVSVVVRRRGAKIKARQDKRRTNHSAAD